MKITVLIFSTNRPEYLVPTLESLNEYLDFSDLDTYKILIDDYPKDRNPVLFRKIKKQFKIDKLVLHKENMGQSRTWSKAWEMLPKDTDYIWHQEDDFLIKEPIDIKKLIRILEFCPTRLSQVCLKRQVWYDPDNDFIYKINHGSVGEEMELRINGEPHHIILHQHYFNANPCVYPYWVTQENYSFNPQESVIAQDLKNKLPPAFSAILGRRRDESKTQHIGLYNQGKKVEEGEPGWDWLKHYDSNKKYHSQGYLKEYKDERNS